MSKYRFVAKDMSQTVSKCAIYNNLKDAIVRWQSGQNRFPKFKHRFHGQSYQAIAGKGETQVEGQIKQPFASLDELAALERNNTPSRSLKSSGGKTVAKRSRTHERESQLARRLKLYLPSYIIVSPVFDKTPNTRQQRLSSTVRVVLGLSR